LQLTNIIIIKQRLITIPRRNIENRKKWNLDNIRNPLKLNNTDK